MPTTIWQELNRRLHLQQRRDEELERLRSINASLEKAVTRITRENETLTHRLAAYDGTYQRLGAQLTREANERMERRIRHHNFYPFPGE